MGLLNIAYFAFCIVSKVMELSIYEQSIQGLPENWQIDPPKAPSRIKFAWRFFVYEELRSKSNFRVKAPLEPLRNSLKKKPTE